MDIFSEILKTLQLHGTVYFHAYFQSPWGMAIPADCYANFHLVTEGSCWLTVKDQQMPLALHKGDMILFPKGDSHVLSDAIESKIIPADEFLQSPRNNRDSEIIYGGKGSDMTKMICGHFEYQNDFIHPLFASLPSIIHLSSNDSDKQDWFSTASELAVQISSSPDSLGKDAIIDKLAESLFIQALLAYIETQDHASVFLMALKDNKIALTLNAIHHDFSYDWNLTELANIASMSKSMFSEKFHNLVGEPPISYLSRWRMFKAHALLRDTMLPINQIADKVGYQSEFSFSKAFKKLTGVSPGEVRKSLKSTEVKSARIADALFDF